MIAIQEHRQLRTYMNLISAMHGPQASQYAEITYILSPPGAYTDGMCKACTTLLTCIEEKGQHASPRAFC